jgi:hypothetical protein
MNDFSKYSPEFEEALSVFYGLMEKAEKDRKISLQAASKLELAVDRFAVTTDASLATKALENAMAPIARNIGDTVKSDMSAMYREAEKAQKCAEAVTTNMTQKARKILWPILGIQTLFIAMILGFIYYFQPILGLEAKREEYATLARNVEFLNALDKSVVWECGSDENVPKLCAKVLRNGVADSQGYYIQQR